MLYSPWQHEPDNGAGEPAVQVNPVQRWYDPVDSPHHEQPDSDGGVLVHGELWAELHAGGEEEDAAHHGQVKVPPGRLAPEGVVDAAEVGGQKRQGDTDKVEGEAALGDALGVASEGVENGGEHHARLVAHKDSSQHQQVGQGDLLQQLQVGRDEEEVPHQEAGEEDEAQQVRPDVDGLVVHGEGTEQARQPVQLVPVSGTDIWVVPLVLVHLVDLVESLRLREALGDTLVAGHPAQLEQVLHHPGGGGGGVRRLNGGVAESLGLTGAWGRLRWVRVVHTLDFALLYNGHRVEFLFPDRVVKVNYCPQTASKVDNNCNLSFSFTLDLSSFLRLI